MTACRRSSRAGCRANAKPRKVSDNTWGSARAGGGRRTRRLRHPRRPTARLPGRRVRHPPAGTAAARGRASEDGASATTPPEEQQPQRGGSPPGDIRLRQAMDYVEEADMLLALFRWTVLTGDLPRPEDWLPRDDWPHPDAVGNVFGNWNKFLEYGGVKDAPPVLRKRSLDEREARLAGQARQL